MPASVFYPVSGIGQSPAPAASSGAAIGRPIGVRMDRAFLGFGLLAPFRRDLKGDFAAAGEEALVRSCVGQVLGTRCASPDGRLQGELPWRPAFGSLLYLLRHRNLDETTSQLARVYAAEAIERWEPRYRLREVRLSTESSIAGGPLDILRVRVLGAIVSSNIAGNQILTQNAAVDVQVR